MGAALFLAACREATRHNIVVNADYSTVWFMLVLFHSPRVFILFRRLGSLFEHRIVL